MDGRNILIVTIATNIVSLNPKEYLIIINQK